MEKENHVFEKAGLGIAPFRCVRVEIRRPSPAIPTNEWPRCDYCGTDIVECYVIRDAQGKEFIVGNSCVKKTSDEGLIRSAKSERAAERREREGQRLQITKAKLNEQGVREHLATQPHPLEWQRRNGKTLLDWAEWAMKYGWKTDRAKVSQLLGV